MSGASELIRKLGLNTRQTDVLTTRFMGGRYSPNNRTMEALSWRGLVYWAPPAGNCTGRWMRTAEGSAAVDAIMAAHANRHDQAFPKRRFYVGIAECGCVQAAMVDDHDTTAESIADFARRQAKLKRRMEHRTCEPGSLWTVDPGCNVHRPGGVA